MDWSMRDTLGADLCCERSATSAAADRRSYCRVTGTCTLGGVPWRPRPRQAGASEAGLSLMAGTLDLFDQRFAFCPGRPFVYPGSLSTSRRLPSAMR